MGRGRSRSQRAHVRAPLRTRDVRQRKRYPASGSPPRGPSIARLSYAIPYDADVVLEIDPENQALFLFGSLGKQPCKWYGGGGRRQPHAPRPPSSSYRSSCALTFVRATHAMVRAALAPNGKIYAIPYASPVVLEIDPEARTAMPFAAAGEGWAKWAGGILAGNGKIYGVPALATGVLEIGAPPSADGYAADLFTRALLLWRAVDDLLL